MTLSWNGNAIKGEHAGLGAAKFWDSRGPGSRLPLPAGSQRAFTVQFNGSVGLLYRVIGGDAAGNEDRPCARRDLRQRSKEWRPLRSFKRALTICARRRRTDVRPNPDAVEALLNKAQRLLDGRRSTWPRRDLDGAMEELTDALRKQP
jgi:hypothetical protein